MKELEILETKIIGKLDKIRNKKEKTLNEREEYKELQKRLREIHRVIAYLKGSD